MTRVTKVTSTISRKELIDRVRDVVRASQLRDDAHMIKNILVMYDFSILIQLGTRTVCTKYTSDFWNIPNISPIRVMLDLYILLEYNKLIDDNAEQYLHHVIVDYRAPRCTDSWILGALHFAEDDWYQGKYAFLYCYDGVIKLINSQDDVDETIIVGHNFIVHYKHLQQYRIDIDLCDKFIVPRSLGFLGTVLQDKIYTNNEEAICKIDLNVCNISDHETFAKKVRFLYIDNMYKRQFRGFEDVNVITYDV